MAPLDYQPRQDFAQENRGGVLRRIFGPFKEGIWRQFADDVNGAYLDGGFFGRDKVAAAAGPWTVTLDTYTVDKTTYTRLRAPFVNTADGLRFSVHRAGLLTPLGKWLGMQDIEVGDAAFDESFVVTGNNERQVRRLLANPRLRDLLAAQPRVHFTVRDDEGWFGANFPAGVDELRFQALGVIRDRQRLRELYDLFAETLNTLCHIGSAYADDPGVKL